MLNNPNPITAISPSPTDEGEIAFSALRKTIVKELGARDKEQYGYFFFFLRAQPSSLKSGSSPLKPAGF